MRIGDQRKGASCMVEMEGNGINHCHQPCDQKVTTLVRSRLYKTVIKPVLTYGSETWPMKRNEDGENGDEEMTLRDKMRSTDIRKELSYIADKWRVGTLRKEEENPRLMSVYVIKTRSLFFINFLLLFFFKITSPINS